MLRADGLRTAADDDDVRLVSDGLVRHGSDAVLDLGGRHLAPLDLADRTSMRPRLFAPAVLDEDAEEGEECDG